MSNDPNALLTVTLPRRILHRVLRAVTTDAYARVRAGKDPGGVETLAAASEVLGDALGAPANQRFRLPPVRYGVVAADAADHERWCRDHPGVGVATLVDSVAVALRHRYYGYVVTAAARRLYADEDLQQIMAAIRSRAVSS